MQKQTFRLLFSKPIRPESFTKQNKAKKNDKDFSVIAKEIN